MICTTDGTGASLAGLGTALLRARAFALGPRVRWGTQRGGRKSRGTACGALRIACAFLLRRSLESEWEKHVDVSVRMHSSVDEMAILLTLTENLRANLGTGADDFVVLLQKFGEATKVEVIEASREAFEKTVIQAELRIEAKLGDIRAEIGQAEGRLEAKIAGAEGRLDAKIGGLRADMGQLEGRLEAKIGSLKGDLEAKIAQSQAVMIRWMFAFWVSQTAFTFGLLMAFFKK